MLEIVFSCDQPLLDSRLQYTLQFLANHPLAPRGGVRLLSQEVAGASAIRIHYGRKPLAPDNTTWFIPAQQLLFTESVQDLSHWPCNTYHYGLTKLYSLEPTVKSPQPWISDHHFAFDLLETIFAHISRYEEVHCLPDQQNMEGWLEEDRQWLVRHALEKQAVVDQLVKSFFEVLTGQTIQQITSYDLSHDVDILYRFRPAYKFFRSLAATVVYRRGWQQLVSSVQHYWQMLLRGRNDPYDSFDWLFSDDPRWTERTVYWMSGGRTRYDNLYDITAHQARKLLTRALQKGYRIGFHPSFDAGFEADLYRIEKEKLEAVSGQNISCNRQHWLRFNWQITPYIWSENHILEDASLGYNRRLGFRCGTGFPYFLYDFRLERPFPWRERPLVLMDSSAIHEAKNTSTDLIQLLEELLHQNRENTHISINFHNSNFDPTLATGRKLIHFYTKILFRK